MRSAPGREGALSYEQIRRYIDEAMAATNLGLVIFAGGEPLLLGEQLYRSLEYAYRRGLMTRLVTNAYWATDPRRAARVARRLYDAGLWELNISIDDYHLDYVDPKRVRLAFDAARELAFQAVIIVHVKGPKTRLGDEQLDQILGVKLPRMYDEDFERVPVASEGDGPYLAVANTTVQGTGRAAAELANDELYLTEKWERRVRELGGCPWAVRSPAISPDGHLVACCGFEATGNQILDIGDLEDAPLGELLARGDDDLALNLIALEGPYAIMDRLRRVDPSLPFKERYSGICSVCQDLTTNPTILQAFQKHMYTWIPDVLAARAALAGARQDD